MIKKTLGVVGLCLIGLSPSALAVDAPRLTIGLGAGYSFPYEDWLSEKQYSLRDVIYFKEGGRLKYNLGADLQVYLDRQNGFQLEYNYLSASYACHLDIFGRWVWTGTEYEYIPINHLEDPYTESWAVHSGAVSYLHRFVSQDRGERLIPYISIGYGLYFLSADQDKVMNRFRLGPKKSGGFLTFGLGFHYRVLPRIRLNCRLKTRTLNRRSGQVTYLETGPDKQFDLIRMQMTGEIHRSQDALARTMTVIGIEVSLEFLLR